MFSNFVTECSAQFCHTIAENTIPYHFYFIFFFFFRLSKGYNAIVRAGSVSSCQGERERDPMKFQRKTNPMVSTIMLCIQEHITKWNNRSLRLLLVITYLLCTYFIGFWSWNLGALYYIRNNSNQEINLPCSFCHAFNHTTSLKSFLCDTLKVLTFTMYLHLGIVSFRSIGQTHVFLRRPISALKCILVQTYIEVELLRYV